VTVDAADNITLKVGKRANRYIFLFSSRQVWLAADGRTDFSSGFRPDTQEQILAKSFYVGLMAIQEVIRGLKKGLGFVRVEAHALNVHLAASLV
jgi:hypothetical protein